MDSDGACHIAPADHVAPARGDANRLTLRRSACAVKVFVACELIVTTF
jgi:hypothetical protein